MSRVGSRNLLQGQRRFHRFLSDCPNEPADAKAGLRQKRGIETVHVNHTEVRTRDWIHTDEHPMVKWSMVWEVLSFAFWHR
ncbi:MAG: hypothetical protein C4530_20910 [Desulfobacteraceae bacterium]|nr:MAG: hypothetical protein C4530_20910 [Desulfobacteraceae bacterium]